MDSVKGVAGISPHGFRQGGCRDFPARIPSRGLRGFPRTDSVKGVAGISPHGFRQGGCGDFPARMISLYAVSNVIDLLQAEAKREKVPSLTPGDSVKVHARVVEGNRERVQIFEGT